MKTIKKLIEDIKVGDQLYVYDEIVKVLDITSEDAKMSAFPSSDFKVYTIHCRVYNRLNGNCHDTFIIKQPSKTQFTIIED